VGVELPAHILASNGREVGQKEPFSWVVEVGERQALPETTAERLLDWLSTAQTSDRLPSHEYDLLFALPIS
jgi:hypothetical protein